MSKSHLTSGKKEREKKKDLKRQEKLQKKEERKAHHSKGKSLEEMFAYVDEFGRLSDTPPDPLKKRTEFSLEDAQISVPKQQPSESTEDIRRGKVTFFNDSKGYGFIKDLDSQESIFVHINNLESPVKENDTVTFEIVNGHKGLNAINVKASA